MLCTNCGYQNNSDVNFCVKCGQPMAEAAPSRQSGLKPKRGLLIIISVSAVVLAAIMLVLMLCANPVAGRWYAQSGTELIMLKNGKGMTVLDGTGEARRVHFMYAIGYREPGYIEGEIYEKESGASTWFYLYDGTLEMNGEYFYRQKPAAPAK